MKLKHDIKLKTASNNLLISIITVVFNGEKFIENSIKSVISQEYKYIEYIIIDGASTDSTINIINEYKDSIDVLISEEDRGIYDAMNKAVSRCRGDFIYFLGADDVLSDPYVISNIAEALNQCNEKPMIIYGHVKTDSGKKIKSIFGRKLLLNNCLHHQSCFYNSDAFISFRYDTNFKIISDYELNLSLYLNKSQHVKISRQIAICGNGGISTNDASYFQHITETNAIRGKLISNPVQSFLKLSFITKAYLNYVIRHF